MSVENNALDPERRGAEQDRIVSRELLAELEQSEEPALEEAPEESKGRAIHLRTASVVFLVLAFVVAIAMVISDLFASRGYVRMARAGENYIEAQIAASEMQAASDYLTARVRYFVITGDVRYVGEYFEELTVVQSREKSVQTIKELLGENDGGATESLDRALDLSNRLATIEYYAMKLMYESGGYSAEDFPEQVLSVTLGESDRTLSSEAMRNKALSLVYGTTYVSYKDRIKEETDGCTKLLTLSSRKAFDEASENLSTVVGLHIATTVAFMIVIFAFVMVIFLQVRKPLTKMIPKMQDKDAVPPTGVAELRFVTATYNRILRENKIANAKMTFMAFHDPLTGLLNRGGHDLLLDDLRTEKAALLLIDIDHFKEINDVHGHAIGDKVLKRVADTLRDNFRSVRIISRLGGDEFAVVLPDVNETKRAMIEEEIHKMSEALRHSGDELPPVTLSVGVAFASSQKARGALYRNADAALYQVKQNGRNGCAFYE